MKLEQLTLPVKNKILSEYWSGSASIRPFFEYDVNEAASFESRAAYLQTKSYQREQLADVITSYMQPFGISEKALSYIQQLREGAVVVVGGQQAGVLTGPLYSVHKAITVILLAQQQREKLQIPVVPMFWIAGEDHDLEEINHSFTIVNSEAKKRGYSERSKLKTMASTTSLNKEVMEKLVRQIFADFGETSYTETLLTDVLQRLQKSETFTDFFTALMNDLFAKHGLLMLDAAYIPFRKMQGTYFEKIVMHNEELATCVVEQEEAFEEADFGSPIQATKDNANVFYVRDGERFLLSRKEDHFVHPAAQIKLSKEELLNIAINHPEQLSNNVVTRPLMQEMTIPVLAFVGGPGELAYWGTLKEAFHTLQLQMPIFVPRMHVTLVSRQVQPLLEQLDLTFEDVYNGRVQQLKEQFIESVQDPAAYEQIDNIQAMLQTQYEQLNGLLDERQMMLDKVLKKNEQFHRNQLQYLKTKIEQEILLKHDVKIRQYTLLQSELYPFENFHERLYTPYQYLNGYGPTLVDDLLALPLAINVQHQIVYL